MCVGDLVGGWGEADQPDQVSTKKPRLYSQGFNKYGSYLLSRMIVQYHRP